MLFGKVFLFFNSVWRVFYDLLCGHWVFVRMIIDLVSKIGMEEGECMYNWIVSQWVRVVGERDL